MILKLYCAMMIIMNMWKTNQIQKRHLTHYYDVPFPQFELELLLY